MSSIKIYNYIFGIFIYMVSALSAFGQEYSKADYKNLFLATLSYHAVAKVCGDSIYIDMSQKALRRIVNFGQHKNILSDEALAYLRNPEEVIRKGEAQYKKDKYVGCSQAYEIIKKLDDVSKRLP